MFLTGSRPIRRQIEIARNQALKPKEPLATGIVTGFRVKIVARMPGLARLDYRIAPEACGRDASDPNGSVVIRTDADLTGPAQPGTLGNLVARRSNTGPDQPLCN